MNEAIVTFPYIHLQVELVCTEDGNMPQYKTSMLRGIIGRIFKKSVCHDFSLACQNCDFSNACAYSAFFEAPERLVRVLNRGGTVPHPYIIRCHDYRTLYRENDTLTFDLLLIGKQAAIFAPYLFHVFTQIVTYPFGKDRLRFDLKSVAQIFSKNNRKTVLDHQVVLQPKLTPFQYSIPDYQKVLIQFITPFRIVRKGNVLRQFVWEEFLWQVNHRVRYLQVLDGLLPGDRGNVADVPPFSGESITVLHEQWDEMVRYSTRQKLPVKVGGVRAAIEVQRTSELDRWLPYLIFTEMFHVGKATTFGLGQYELWFK